MTLFIFQYCGPYCYGGAAIVAESEPHAHQILYKYILDQELKDYQEEIEIDPDYEFYQNVDIDDGICGEGGAAYTKVYECEVDQEIGVKWLNRYCG